MKNIVILLGPLPVAATTTVTAQTATTVYHNGAINTDGGSYSRSVCIDTLEYRADGTIKRINMTSEGPFNEIERCV